LVFLGKRVVLFYGICGQESAILSWRVEGY